MLVGKPSFYLDANLVANRNGQPVVATSKVLLPPALKTGSWEVSVVGAGASANLLPPITVPMPVRLPGSLVGEVPSELAVTLVHGGVNYQSFVVVNSPSFAAYGTVYCVYDLLNRFNAAFAAAFAAIPESRSSAPPFLAFDPATQLITMFFQESYNAAGDRILIYMNSKAYGYLLSLEASFLGYNTVTGLDFLIATQSKQARIVSFYPSWIPTGVATATPGNNVLALTQQGPSLAAWSRVRAIVIKTNLPLLGQDWVEDQLDGGSVLVEFPPGGTPGGNPVTRQTVEYLGGAFPPPRQLQESSRKLDRIELRWGYVTQDGDGVHELMLPPGGSANVRLMFRAVS